MRYLRLIRVMVLLATFFLLADDLARADSGLGPYLNMRVYVMTDSDLVLGKVLQDHERTYFVKLCNGSNIFDVSKDIVVPTEDECSDGPPIPKVVWTNYDQKTVVWNGTIESINCNLNEFTLEYADNTSSLWNISDLNNCTDLKAGAQVEVFATQEGQADYISGFFKPSDQP